MDVISPSFSAPRRTRMQKAWHLIRMSGQALDEDDDSVLLGGPSAGALETHGSVRRRCA